ncbi:transposase [Rubrobacter xylanophilus]|nr:transposase [Rubrobacter xylanophilus]
MRFAQTNRNRRRFLHDVPTVSYHPSSGRPGCPHAVSPRHRRSGHPDNNRADHAVRERPYPFGWASDAYPRVALFLPGRAHDALNRLLRVMLLSTRALMGVLIAWIKRHGEEDGYLCLDDCLIEKAFAKKLPWAGWTYSFAKKRKVYGLHIVVLLWCTSDGRWRIPVAFRLWRPKRSCAPHTYRTKLRLAEVMIKEVIGSGLKARYIVFDTHYTAGWFTKMVRRLGLVWVGTLPPRTSVVWRGQRRSVAELARRVPLKWHKRLGMRATAVVVYAPKYGSLRLVVTRNRHGNHEYIVTNDPGGDLTTVVLRKMRRWSIETLFRDSKQFAGLEACQCRVDQAMVRHVGLVLLTCVVMQMMRRFMGESVGSVKERWQLEVMRDGESSPPLLKACPLHLRATA